MNAVEISRWLCGESLPLIHCGGEKWVFARYDAGQALCVSRFDSITALDAFLSRRDSLKAAAGSSEWLCIPSRMKTGDRDGEWLLAESMPLAQSPKPKEAHSPERLEALFDALEALHAAGWTHMDIKPEHLLRIDGRWRLIDFDGAMPLGARYSRRDITFDYAPPEVLWHDVADGQDDLYALALVLYKAHNRDRLPFRREGRASSGWIGRVFRQIPAPEGATEAQRAFFRRALARHRIQRFPTIKAFRSAWNAVSNEKGE